MIFETDLREDTRMSVEFFWRLPTHGDGREAHDEHTRGEWREN